MVLHIRTSKLKRRSCQERLTTVYHSELQSQGVVFSMEALLPIVQLSRLFGDFIPSHRSPLLLTFETCV
jgi:hypothetical protein